MSNIRKALISIAFFLFLFSLISNVKAATCVEPYENMLINSDTVLCPGSYYLNDSDRNGAIQVTGSNFVITCNDTEIYGDYNTTWWGGLGFYIDGANNVTIVGCKLREYAHPIVSENTFDVTLKNLNITHWGVRGIWGLNNTRLTIRDSFFSNHTDSWENAVDLSGGEENAAYPCEKINSYIYVYNNSFTNMKRGARFGECVYNSTIDSNIFDNTVTIAIGTDLGLYKIIGEASNATISNNIINSTYGILIGTDNNNIYNNVFSGCMIAIGLRMSNNSIYFNNATGVTYFIFIGPGDNNKIYNNTISADTLAYYHNSTAIPSINVTSNILSCNNTIISFNKSWEIDTTYLPTLVNVMRIESSSCTPYISYVFNYTVIDFGIVTPYNTYNQTGNISIDSNMVNITFSVNGTDMVGPSIVPSTNIQFSPSKNLEYPTTLVPIESIVKYVFYYLPNEFNNIVENLFRFTVPLVSPGNYSMNVTIGVSV